MTRGAVEWLRDARDYANQALFDGGGLDSETLAIAKQPLHATLFDRRGGFGSGAGGRQGVSTGYPVEAVQGPAQQDRSRLLADRSRIIAAVLDRDLDPLIRALDRLIDVIGRES